MIAAAVLLAAYLFARTRRPAPERRIRHALAAIGAAVALSLAFAPAIEGWAARTFTGHMVQHLMLLTVVPPLAAMTHPLTTTIGAERAQALGLLDRATAPAVGWFAVVFVVVAGHLPPIYDATAGPGPVHALAHLAYLAAGIAYWLPILGTERSVAGDHGRRLLALIGLPPVLALVAAGIGSTGRVTYDLASSPADQQRGAALMWLAPLLAWLPTLIWLVLDWARHDTAEPSSAPGILIR